ncbi:MAG: helix-turn-helix transcriptional regulator [Kofleriaceae bacterium]
MLDRFYDLEADDVTWMRGLAEAIGPLVDCGAGVFTCAVGTVPEAEPLFLSRDYDCTAMWRRLQAVVPQWVFVEVMQQMPISNTDMAAPHLRRFASTTHRAMGMYSCSGINAARADGVLTVSIPAPTRGIVFWPEQDRQLWDRIAAHLSAAFRLRGNRDPRPRLVFDERGRLLHAEPDVARDRSLPSLRDAAEAVARARNRRLPPAKVLAAWRALYQGDWSIVESVQRDGRRLLLARPNAPLALSRSSGPGSPPSPGGGSPPRPALSPTERRVLAALASGHSNKAIAYQLGLADSTVSTLLARAARKLGCRNRVELTVAARAARAGDAPPDPDA